MAAADAFIADLQQQGAVQPEVGTLHLNRRAAPATTTQTTTTTTEYAGDLGGGTAEDAGAGAVKGTVAGALTGAAAGIIGTAATVATGGLALPVILGMTALGSGVGAAVGGIGGAAGVDETGDGMTRTTSSSEVEDTHYDRMQASLNEGGRAVAVDDNVPQDVLEEAVRRHGGQFVNGDAGL
ncbi:hypothetical protein DEIPH_ctg012orf0034 [Deinococcus phoenicis]|uniref:Uncharacterized protein n=1 Tax=Deinococcus phoenicis TaxID=1476583 RepID=A0A016QT54_9DEIO|nr:hypothetical protein DEIPH_ctg012orf0034 [Deinococcus phoenicis]